MADSTSSSAAITATKSSSGRLRLAGLSSGVDVDGLVKAALTNENKRVENQQKKITKQEWTQSAYEALNSKIADFQSAFLTLGGKNDMSLASSLASRKVTLSNDSAVKVTAANTVDVDDVTILSTVKARAASISSAEYDSKDISSKTLKELFGTGLKTKKNADNEEVYEFKVKVNEDGKMVEKTVEIGADKKVEDLVSKINNSKDLGFKFNFNSFSGKFEISSANTGKDAEISIGSNTVFGSSDLMAKIFAGSDRTAKGTDAEITFKVGEDAQGNPIGKTHTFSSNQFTVGGYTFSIQKDSNEAIEVSSRVDTDSMVNKIKSFVDSYNELMKSLHEAAYTVNKKSGTDPLTSEEKKTMSESEIKEYEENAKKGLLYGDKDIRNLMERMRKLFNSTISDSGLKMRDIGIAEAAYSKDSNPYGKIEINEDKLRNAIEQNASDVASLFASRNESNGSTKGIAVAMREFTQSYQNNYKFKVSDRLSSNLEQMKKLLETLKEKLEDKEDKLYNKYAVMETTISKMSSQSAFLFS